MQRTSAPTWFFELPCFYIYLTLIFNPEPLKNPFLSVYAFESGKFSASLFLVYLRRYVFHSSAGFSGAGLFISLLRYWAASEFSGAWPPSSSDFMVRALKKPGFTCVICAHSEQAVTHRRTHAGERSYTVYKHNQPPLEHRPTYTCQVSFVCVWACFM